MRCIVCGSDATVGSFCDEHFLAREHLLKIDNIELCLCEVCGAYFDGFWKRDMKMEDVIADAVRKRVKSTHTVKRMDIALKPFGNKFTAMIRCSGFIKPCKTVKEEEHKIIITMKKRKCDDCVRKSGNYYEGVIQVRGDKKDAIMDVVRKTAKEGSIGKIRQNGEGYDVQFIRKSDAKRVVVSLKNRYDVKRSFKFVTEKKGTKLYRNFYSVR